ncbi:MAG TPA: beta-ketoacyl-ACP synthase III [Streptosporangiaceae bacterium]
MPDAVLAGVGAWTPPRIVTNDDLAAYLDTSDEWIYSRTGIRQRRIADPGVATSDLAVEAGARALKSAEIDHVDAVILATTTPDRPCPATAPDVASRLGVTGIAAFDVAAVCSGFLYALAAAAGLIATEVAGTVLVIGAETYSTILNPTDRTTRALFGDGAGAVVLRAGRADEPGALGPFDLGSDGRYAELISIPGGGSRQRSTGRPAPDGDQYFVMQGQPVFRHAIVRMAESALAVIDRAGWRVDDIDRFVAHQANRRILVRVARRLGIPEERCVMNLERVANTAAASIPLALADAVADGRLRPGHRVLLTAFGGGFTWGATTVRWPDITPA